MYYYICKCINQESYPQKMPLTDNSNNEEVEDEEEDEDYCSEYDYAEPENMWYKWYIIYNNNILDIGTWL